MTRRYVHADTRYYDVIVTPRRVSDYAARSGWIDAAIHADGAMKSARGALRYVGDSARVC